MTPQTFARAVVSIESKYGLRLDAAEVWLRLDEFKKVKELKGGKCNESKGWYGLKGACKRGKKGEGAVRAKESKLDIAGRIRSRKSAVKNGTKSTPENAIVEHESVTLAKKAKRAEMEAVTTSTLEVKKALKLQEFLSKKDGEQLRVDVDPKRYGGKSKAYAFTGSPSNPEFGGNSRIFMARSEVSSNKPSYDALDTVNHLQQMSGFGNAEPGKPSGEDDFYKKQAVADLAKVWENTSQSRKEQLAEEHGSTAIDSSNSLVRSISRELSTIRLRQEAEKNAEREKKKAQRLASAKENLKTELKEKSRNSKDDLDSLFDL